MSFLSHLLRSAVRKFARDCYSLLRILCRKSRFPTKRTYHDIYKHVTGQLQSVQYCFHNGNGKYLLLWFRCAFSFGFFLFFFFYKQVFRWVVGCGGFHDNWDLGSQEILSSLRTFTNQAERTLDLPRLRSRQGTSPWLST